MPGVLQVLEGSIFDSVTGNPILRANHETVWTILNSRYGSLDPVLADLKSHGVTWLIIAGDSEFLLPNWAQGVDFPAKAKQYGIQLYIRIGGGTMFNGPASGEQWSNAVAVIDPVLNNPDLNDMVIGWYFEPSWGQVTYLNDWINAVRSYDTKHRNMFLLAENPEEIISGMPLVAGDKLSVYIPWGTKVPIPWGWPPYYGFDPNWMDTSKTASYVQHAKNVIASKYPQVTFTPFDFATYAYDANAPPISYQFSSEVCPTDVMKSRINAIKSVIGSDICYNLYYGYYTDHVRDHSFYGDGSEAWKALTTPSPLISALEATFIGIGFILIGI